MQYKKNYQTQKVSSQFVAQHIHNSGQNLSKQEMLLVLLIMLKNSLLF